METLDTIDWASLALAAKKILKYAIIAAVFAAQLAVVNYFTTDDPDAPQMAQESTRIYLVVR